MGDWLGTGTIATRSKEFRSFEEARMFARSLSLKSRAEWEEYYKSGNRPSDIPSSPWLVYKNKGWDGFLDWFGRELVKKDFK